MEDREGMRRLRRHDRRWLPPGVDHRGRRSEVVDESAGGVNAELARRTRCEQLTFLDGRRKYVCAAFGSQSGDEEASWMRTANYTEYGSLRAGKRMGRSGLSMLLEVFGRSGRGERGDGGGACGSFVVGCLATAVRIAALLLSRSLCEGAWPVLQALSICTVPLGPLKQLVSAVDSKLGQLRGLKCLLLKESAFLWDFFFLVMSMFLFLGIAGASRGCQESCGADSRASVGHHSCSADCPVVFAECVSHTQVLEASSPDLLPVVTLLLLFLCFGFQ